MVKYYAFKDLLALSSNKILSLIPSDLGQLPEVELHKKQEIGLIQAQGRGIIKHLKSQPYLYSLSDNNGNEIVRISPNPYPYYTDTSLEVIIWLWKPDCLTVRKASCLLQILGYTNHIIWENPPSRQSIPEIRHFHALISRQSY